MPAHDPRALQSMGIAYATANRGACHLQAVSYILELGYAMPEIGFPESMDQFQVKDKAKMTALMQNVASMLDSLKICKFLMYSGVTLQDLIDWINLVTGWDMDLEEFLTCGERIYNLKRIYNVKNGIRRKDDTLPYRLLHETRTTGNAAGRLPALDIMLKEYYDFRDWDEEGIPSVRKMVELGINHFM